MMSKLTIEELTVDNLFVGTSDRRSSQLYFLGAMGLKLNLKRKHGKRAVLLRVPF